MFYAFIDFSVLDKVIAQVVVRKGGIRLDRKDLPPERFGVMPDVGLLPA